MEQIELKPVEIYDRLKEFEVYLSSSILLLQKYAFVSRSSILQKIDTIIQALPDELRNNSDSILARQEFSTYTILDRMTGYILIKKDIFNTGCIIVNKDFLIQLIEEIYAQIVEDILIIKNLTKEKQQ